ncbi:Protein of unknown function, partial [Gryllus bimaculatus]
SASRPASPARGPAPPPQSHRARPACARCPRRRCLGGGAACGGVAGAAGRRGALGCGACVAAALRLLLPDRAPLVAPLAQLLAQRWLDLERAAELRALVAALAARGAHSPAAQRCRLWFLVRTSARALADAARLLRSPAPYIVIKARNHDMLLPIVPQKNISYRECNLGHSLVLTFASKLTALQQTSLILGIEGFSSYKNV